MFAEISDEIIGEKMLLEKNDLKEIAKIVDSSAEKTKKELRTEIKNQIGRIDLKIEVTKNEIISVISREVNDLADINRAVINKMEELDYRLRIVERKLGLNIH